MKLIRINNNLHSVFHLNDKEATAVEQAIEQKKTFVKVRGILVNLKKELDFFGDEEKLALNTSGEQCHGQHSIQYEITRLAKSSGDGWAKRLTDRQWRKQTYDQLYQQSDKWCDHLKNACYCEPEAFKTPFDEL